ncbi:MAG TPA: phage holin family protein [Nevskiaceae bacterium]|nr:phage holin family protein [Nevskiaceae bacterium]
MSEDVSTTLRRLSTQLIDHAHTRLALLKSEIAEERSRLGGLLWRAVFAILAGFMVAEVVVLSIVAAFWDTPWRWASLAVIGVCAVAGTAAFWRSLTLHLQRTSPLFEASLAQLEKDREMLERLTP